jgi:hypothetical protein
MVEDSSMCELAEVMEQIKAREPLLHHRELVYSAETFDREISEDFWEVGASGQVYSRERVREVILARLSSDEVDEFVAEGWRTVNHHVRALGKDTYLFTYVLQGQGRTTRRSTIWRHGVGRGWHALYHQGTVVPDP